MQLGADKRPGHFVAQSGDWPNESGELTVRWSYLIPRLLIVSLLWGFLAWGKDPLLRYCAISAVQSVTGARAEVGAFAVQLYPPRVSVGHVALASAHRPGTNLVQFDDLELRLAGPAFLRRQFVVEEGRLTGVLFQTQRIDDGQLQHVPRPDQASEPSWLTEQLQQAGEEWLTSLVQQTAARLDPNQLETYRVGSEVYSRWDGRFNEMTDRTKLLKPRYEQLKLQFEQARRGDPLQRMEQYVQITHRAEKLVRDAQQVRDELQSIGPEVKVDFARLNQARKNDQQLVMHTIDLLKPDSRRVTEALIGRQMYLQLQHVLSWLDLARNYRQELVEQTRPERHRGVDFEFPWFQPTPDFHIQRLMISGQVEIGDELVPFEAELADVTEDAPLLGRPCVFRLRTDGQQSIALHVTYDARQEIAVTRVQASWSDASDRLLTSGENEEAQFSARLDGIEWDANLTLVQERLSGAFRLRSRLGDARFVAPDSIRPEFVNAATQALQAVDSVDATVALSGTLRKPALRLQSDLGQQIVDGVQLAFHHEIQLARDRLMADVNAYASDQVNRLTSRFSNEYQQLRDQNAQFIAQVQDVCTLASTVRTGEVDAESVFRLASESKLISPQQQQQVDRAFNDIQQGLSGKLPATFEQRLPANALETRLPGLLQQTVPESSGLPGFSGFGSLLNPVRSPQTSSRFEDELPVETSFGPADTPSP